MSVFIHTCDLFLGSFTTVNYPMPHNIPLPQKHGLVIPQAAPKPTSTIPPPSYGGAAFPGSSLLDPCRDAQQSHGVSHGFSLHNPSSALFRSCKTVI
ncbi:hypothetical protein LB506_007419 [Fusarium annulatum]|nr:hypothetical protein LB506_007419 [Fusarium annulatum]